MNIYLYDPAITQKSNLKEVAKIETRLTDLGLNGKIIRLGFSQSVAETIDTETRKGAKTFVVVGGQKLFSQALNALVKMARVSPSGKKIPLAYIPTTDNFITEYLGLKINEAACDILSARRIESFGLGLVNNEFFLAQISIPTEGTKLEIDENYTVEIAEKGKIIVANTNEAGADGSPSRHKLSLQIQTGGLKTKIPFNRNLVQPSTFNFKILTIINHQHPILQDNALALSAPARVSLASEQVSLVVGRGRQL